jgi:hypothetical protein
MESKTFHGRKAEDLTFEQRKRPANMINLIEERSTEDTPERPVIKGRSVFNGRVQRTCTQRKNGLTNGLSRRVFLTSIDDTAIEGHDKAITDIKGRYLSAKMERRFSREITGK